MTEEFEPVIETLHRFPCGCELRVVLIEGGSVERQWSEPFVVGAPGCRILHDEPPDESNIQRFAVNP